MFAEYLQEGLDRKGWSRYRLAKELGRSATGINLLVRGEMGVGAGEDLLREIAAKLDLDGDRLVILSAELYPEGTVRWKYSKLLSETVDLRNEVTVLRNELASLRHSVRAAV